MARVLLTGGSGFIAMHILRVLLERGHSVVTTVRTQTKADEVRSVFSSYSGNSLDFVFVPDVGRPDAFDEAVKSEPPFEAVVHTASPFSLYVKDIKADLIDPAVNGTINILHAIKRNAPTVNRVVITGSFVSMLDIPKGLWPGHTYDETDWNPITLEQALSDVSDGYAASKTFAEKAAWEFCAKESPRFTCAVILPPMVYGPILQQLKSLDSLSESNKVIRSFITGAMKDEIPATEFPIFADVRDVALSHVKAMEEPEAGNKRFFVTNGHYSNREIIDIIRRRFPQYKDQIPALDVQGGELPADLFQVDTQRSEEILGIKYRTLEACIVDTIKSFQAVESQNK